MPGRVEYAYYHTTKDGYCRWDATDDIEYVFVHQLTAIMAGENPHDVFAAESVVHHKNKHKYDNRPENLELMSNSEHASHHYTRIEENVIVTETGCSKIRSDYPDRSLEEIADEMSVSISCVWSHLSGDCEHHDQDHTQGYDGPRNGEWRDFETFYEEYVVNGKSSKQLSDEWGCSLGTITNWKNKHGIDHDNR